MILRAGGSGAVSRVPHFNRQRSIIALGIGVGRVSNIKLIGIDQMQRLHPNLMRTKTRQDGRIRALSVNAIGAMILQHGVRLSGLGAWRMHHGVAWGWVGAGLPQAKGFFSFILDLE